MTYYETARGAKVFAAGAFTLAGRSGVRTSRTSSRTSGRGWRSRDDELPPCGAMIDARYMRLPLAGALMLAIAATVSGAAQTTSPRPAVASHSFVERISTQSTSMARGCVGSRETEIRRARQTAVKVRLRRQGGIWVVDADGKTRRRLTSSSRWEFGPTWSADGKSLPREDGIYRVRADGTGVRRVTAHLLSRPGHVATRSVLRVRDHRFI